MKVISVNVSLPKSVRFGDRVVMTGIYKEPVMGRVRLGLLNLEGDGQADPRYHGGPDKAVYAYPVEHYTYWRDALSRELPFGQFGENLTTEGLSEEALRSGDVLRIGTAELQVTDPREPCGKLALKMGSMGFPKLFKRSGRCGFYLRVLKVGEIAAGDDIVVEVGNRAAPTIAELFRQ